MRRIKSDDAKLFIRPLAMGLRLSFCTPFPLNHEFWLPVAQSLSTRYRLIMPDLRGHGDSDIGEGSATMAKHAADIARVMDDADVGRAPIVGISIGGYVCSNSGGSSVDAWLRWVSAIRRRPRIPLKRKLDAYKPQQKLWSAGPSRSSKV